MRKQLVLATVLALMASVSAWAAAPTLAEKTDSVETQVFGKVTDGAMVDRVDSMQRVVYGGLLRDKGLAEEVDALYDDVVRSSTTKPSLVTRASTLEWQLQNKISRDSLETRLAAIEKTLYGEVKKGALERRMLRLEKTVYEDRHYELKEVELPANTVFKIALDEEVGTKTSEKGDIVHFSVAQDVFVGDVLVLPKGTQGIGVIEEVKKPRSFGRRGELKIHFNQVFSIEDAPIETVLGPEAQERLKHEAAAIGASAVGALALGPIGLVGGFFVKGSDVEMPAGTELYIQVAQTVKTHGVVAVDGAPQYTAADIVVTEDSVAQKGETNAETKTRLRADEAAQSDAVTITPAAEETAESVLETEDSADQAIDEAQEEDAADTEEVKAVEGTPTVTEAEEKAADAAAEAEAAAAKAEVKAAEPEADTGTVTTEEEHLPVVIIRQ